MATPFGSGAAMSCRLSFLLFGTVLVLSCTTHEVAGPLHNRAPTARITTVPADSIQEGSPISFDASASSDPDGDSLTYVWDLGDGLSATGPSALRSYYQRGSHAVTVIVTDQHGASDTATTRVRVVNAPPVITRIEGPAGSIGVSNPTAVHVAASDAGGDVLDMRIDWKDGSTERRGYPQDQLETIASHTYSATGTYAVEVTVQDKDSAVTKRVIDKPIVVVANNDPSGNRAPAAKIITITTATTRPSGSYPEGTFIRYDATSSSDPDGDSLSYRWIFGNRYAPEPTAPSVVRQYVDEGTYGTTLIVTDTHGASDTATVVETVVNVPPAVSYVVTAAGAVLVGTSTAIRFTVQDAGAEDSVSAQVDWKDGTVSTATLTPHSYDNGFNATAAHTYAIPGDYAAEIAARDNDGGVTKVVVDHPISAVAPHDNHAPVAHITGPASGKEGGTLEFSAAGSTDIDGDSLKVTCQWKEVKSQPTYGGKQSCWLKFPDSGTDLLYLIVADPSGAADTASMMVTIENVAPVIQDYWVPGQQAVGIPASVQVSFYDPGTADHYTITVDWGDGTSRSVAVDSIPHGRVTDPYGGIAGDTVFHVYQQPGSYVSTVTVRDDDGGMSSMTAPHAVLVFNADERTTVAGYEVFDLGTLGGNSAKPWDLNDRGQIVGASSVANGATHAFLWDESGMRDLGTLGHEGSEAVRINEAGTIVGTAWTKYRQSWDGPAGRSADYLGRPVGALWQNGLGTLLDSTQAGPPLRVLAMNEVGDVAWTHIDRTDGNFGWLWRNGNWQPLFRGDRASLPYAINDRGDVVGVDSHAAIWSDGSERDLGVLACKLYSASGDCSFSAAMDINESGQVVGITNDGWASGAYHFVLWQGDTVQDLGPAPPGAGIVIVINERGQIAGSAGDNAYFWSDGNRVTLPSLGGMMRVAGLNDNGEVVGTVFLSNNAQHVFVWSQARGMVDLGTGPHGLGAAWVTDINARGDILGYAAPSVGYGNGEVRAILWRNTQASATR
ncbi:MAG TPA: PKD domain-containing protein [Gemmatimonadales bacterium]